MSKRSLKFARRAQDAYDTPAAAVTPLLPSLLPDTSFCEPCAGAGALVDHLKAAGFRCAGAWDIEPRRADIKRADALTMIPPTHANVYVTNPPWSRTALHPLIAHLSAQLPTWLLFDSDWAFTQQSAPFMPWCRCIIAVGRVRWIPGTTMDGYDNAAWYLFDRTYKPTLTLFYGRAIAMVDDI